AGAFRSCFCPCPSPAQPLPATRRRSPWSLQCWLVCRVTVRHTPRINAERRFAKPIRGNSAAGEEGETMKRLFRAAAFAGFLAAAAALPRLWRRLRSLEPGPNLNELTKE